MSAHIGGKRLELLKELVPTASLVAVVHNPADLANVLVVKELREAAPTLGLKLLSVEVRGPDEFERGFSMIEQEGAHALFGVPESSPSRIKMRLLLSQQKAACRPCGDTGSLSMRAV